MRALTILLVACFWLPINGNAEPTNSALFRAIQNNDLKALDAVLSGDSLDLNQRNDSGAASCAHPCRHCSLRYRHSGIIAGARR